MKIGPSLIGFAGMTFALSACPPITARVVRLGDFRTRDLYRVTCPVSPDCEIEMGRKKICPSGLYGWFACPVNKDTPTTERRTELVVCNHPGEQHETPPKKISLSRCDDQGIAEVLEQ